MKSPEMPLPQLRMFTRICEAMGRTPIRRIYVTQGTWALNFVLPDGAWVRVYLGTDQPHEVIFLDEHQEDHHDEVHGSSYEPVSFRFSPSNPASLDEMIATLTHHMTPRTP